MPHSNNCLNCGTRLSYGGSGRRPRYCSQACKSRAKRARSRFGAIRGAFQATFESPPPLSELERAEHRVRLAEERLEQAKELRAALDSQPKPAQRHVTTSWQSFADRPAGI